MTEPLSDARLAEIRERAAGLYEFSLPENLPAEAVALAGEDVPDLLAEVDRLRAERVEHRRTVEYFDAQSKRHKAQRDEARTESESRRQAAAANGASAEVLQRQIEQQSSELDRLGADLGRIQRWAVETVHGSAAAEVLLLIRDLPAASPERPCDRVQPHPAHKHVARRVSWQCPGIPATPTT